jgi:leucyl aminopeptidase (aminopeptidase T)
MEYQDRFIEENEEVKERLELVIERIREIAVETVLEDKYQAYFSKMAGFILETYQVLEQEESGALDHRSMEECQEMNQRLYEDITPKQYGTSYANPTFAVEALGEEFGASLCMLYAELRALISYAFEGRKQDYTILCELFSQIYACFTDEDGTSSTEVEQAIYWFFHDYSEMFSEQNIREMVDPSYDFFTLILMKSDLTDLRYLYRYGEYISDDELRMAAYMNTMNQEQIQAMADTYSEGYRIGFQTTGKDITIKSTVCVEYPIGMERMVRAAVDNFAKIDLKPVIYRDAVTSFRNRGNAKRGCYSKSVNRQFDYDHKADRALYLDKAFVERRLETMRSAFEAYKTLAKGLGGPAVIEVFGEAPFEPVNKKEALHYDEKQNQLNVYQASMSGQITNQFIPGEERSFTIIAYPVPSIGDQFQEIFAKTVELNTLDYVLYRDMQQKIIDVLDTGTKVHVTGKNGNQTDLYISLYPLKNSDKETIFENCVADVNIPVGEVFTSPVLKGTNGILHVSQVYLHELKYIDLKITFTDGMITDYTCANFDSEEENRRYIYENVLMFHESLPMGEFAVGTNTTAYRMAREFAIADKMPILIAEKTGPHFAVGDTCYSHQEDTAVYNPDGKEIVARENEISAKRSEDMGKAYLNCHTDITIPYDELDCITVYRPDGSKADIICGGLFVVPGTEELNRPLIS